MVTIQSLGSAFFRQQLAVAIYKLADVLENLTYVTGLPQESIGLIIGSIAFFLITYFSLAPLAFGRVSREKRWEELTPETQDDWKMRTSNLVKGTAFGFDAAYIVITDILAGRAYLFERICHRRAHGERLTAIAMGFYLWHSVSLVRKICKEPAKPRHWQDLFHHIASCSCSYISLTLLPFPRLSYFLSFEITNIPYNLSAMSEILGHKRAKETFESLWIQSFRCIRLVFGFYVALANIYDTRPQDGVMLTGASAVSSQIEELARLWCRLCAWLIFLLCIDWYGKINNRKEKATATNAAEAVPEPQSFDRACPAISQTLVACETLIRASLAQLELVSSLLKEIQASGQHSTQDDGGGGGVVVGVGSEATNLIPAYATSPSAQME